jgi:hypothetical protein
VSILVAYGSVPPLAALHDALRAAGHELLISATAKEAVELAVSRRAAHLLTLVAPETPAALATLGSEWNGRVVLFLEDPLDTGLAGQIPHTLLGACLSLRRRPTMPSLATLVTSYLSGTLPNLGAHLDPETPSHKLQLTSSLKRGEVLAELERFTVDQRIDQRFVGQFLTIADEFITNAFYNAPVDAAGGRMYAHVSRLEIVESPKYPVQITYARDSHLMAIAVRDGFGSMEKPTLLNCLSLTAKNALPVRFDASGAGLGINTAFRAASHLSFRVATDEFTECLGLIEIGEGYRSFVEHDKTYDVFYRPVVTRS